MAGLLSAGFPPAWFMFAETGSVPWEWALLGAGLVLVLSGLALCWFRPDAGAAPRPETAGPIALLAAPALQPITSRAGAAPCSSAIPCTASIASGCWPRHRVRPALRLHRADEEEPAGPLLAALERGRPARRRARPEDLDRSVSCASRSPRPRGAGGTVCRDRDHRRGAVAVAGTTAGAADQGSARADRAGLC